MRPHYSRRALLFATVGTASTTVALGTSFHAAFADKLSQRVVAYQDRPDGEKRCDRCTHFQPPEACQIVLGTIRPDGYCKLFTLRPQS
jgi:hypothetical protein